MKQQDVGYKYGFRSGLEEYISDQLDLENIKYTYEEVSLSFTQPSKKRKYTPDFLLTKLDGTQMFIETKGRFVREDRQKMKLIRHQYPDLDIRLVFSNPNSKLYKGSKTTYAKWCEKEGFKYAKGCIPEDWLDECR